MTADIKQWLKLVEEITNSDDYDLLTEFTGQSNPSSKTPFKKSWMDNSERKAKATTASVRREMMSVVKKWYNALVRSVAAKDGKITLDDVNKFLKRHFINSKEIKMLPADANRLTKFVVSAYNNLPQDQKILIPENSDRLPDLTEANISNKEAIAIKNLFYGALSEMFNNKFLDINANLKDGEIVFKDGTGTDDYESSPANVTSRNVDTTQEVKKMILDAGKRVGIDDYNAAFEALKHIGSTTKGDVRAVANLTTEQKRLLSALGLAAISRIVEII